MQQNILILIASYIFYGWWDWRFLLLILFTSLCSYASGISIAYYDGNRKIQKRISVTNIIINILILVVFKYFNFFVDSFAIIFCQFGCQIDVITLNVILPVGISFYIFQALSYSIDVYLNKIKPTKDIVLFFAYISFFPQLVAGPIERATNLLPQFNQPRLFDYAQSVDGLRQMLWGFFKKVVVADVCANYVNQNWDYYEELPSLMLIELAVLFTFQIYCDFSGYSDIAIGCAKLFGIRLKRNFDLPYFSRNIAEFWRRWHISLMSWLRDYVYIPLGGNRCSRWRVIINILIVFFISGLWHGANWTFVIWGLYNGFLIVVANVIGWNTKQPTTTADSKRFPNMGEFASTLLTFVLVVIGWIIFRAESLEQMSGYFQALFINPLIGSGLQFFYVPTIAIIGMLMIEWVFRTKQYPLSPPMTGMFRHRVVRWATYYVLTFAIYRFWGYSQSFIYFQF